MQVINERIEFVSLEKWKREVNLVALCMKYGGWEERGTPSCQLLFNFPSVWIFKVNYLKI